MRACSVSCMHGTWPETLLGSGQTGQNCARFFATKDRGLAWRQQLQALTELEFRMIIET